MTANLAQDRKASRRLRDYRHWKSQPREPLIPEDAGRELEFAWGEAWDLGWIAALEAAPPVTPEGQVTEALREELRVLMLQQPTTEKRETYSDGFAMGLSHAIHRLDALAATRPVALDAGWDANSDPIQRLYAIADAADPLKLVEIQAGDLRALVAEHRCATLSPEPHAGVSEALERLGNRLIAFERHGPKTEVVMNLDDLRELYGLAMRRSSIAPVQDDDAELIAELRELAETAPDPRPMSAVMRRAADRLARLNQSGGSASVEESR
jgi:hypothetical protein